MGDRLLDFGGKICYNTDGMEKVYRDKDWLWEHYIVREESTYAIAKEAGCGGVTIFNWLHRYEIPVRNSSEGIFLARRNSVVIVPDLLGFFKGRDSWGWLRENAG